MQSKMRTVELNLVDFVMWKIIQPACRGVLRLSCWILRVRNIDLLGMAWIVHLASAKVLADAREPLARCALVRRVDSVSYAIDGVAGGQGLRVCLQACVHVARHVLRGNSVDIM